MEKQLWSFLVETFGPALAWGVAGAFLAGVLATGLIVWLLWW